MSFSTNKEADKLMIIIRVGFSFIVNINKVNMTLRFEISKFAAICICFISGFF